MNELNSDINQAMIDIAEISGSVWERTQIQKPNVLNVEAWTDRFFALRYLNVVFEILLETVSMRPQTNSLKGQREKDHMTFTSVTINTSPNQTEWRLLFGWDVLHVSLSNLHWMNSVIILGSTYSDILRRSAWKTFTKTYAVDNIYKV